MNVLPKGWVETTLGEIADTSLGKMLDKKQATGDHPTQYLRNINVRWGKFDLNDLASMDIRPEELERVVAVPGDIIACEGGEPGRSAVWHGPGTIALQKALHRIRPMRAVDPRYLAALLHYLALSRSLDSLFTGTTIRHLPQEKLRLVPVPLPPLSEQGRIVAAIEAQFSRLAEAELLLKSARRRLTPMAAAVIDGATMGFASKSIGELIREPLRNGHSARRSATGTVPVFTLSSVTERDFSDRNTKLIDADPKRVEDLWVEPGDIFVERSNTAALVGSAALYRGPAKKAIFPDLLIRIRFGTAVTLEYSELALRSTPIRRYFQRSAKGIAGSMPKIDQTTILAAELPVPPVVEQMRIVEEASRQLSLVESLATAIDHALTRSDHLRRSILEGAFTGKLVPQVSDDEPASELLARIASDHRKTAKPRRRQRA